MIADAERGSRDGRRWRAEHPGAALASLGPIMTAWLAQPSDRPSSDESPAAFAADAESFEAYRAAFVEAAGGAL